MVVDVVLTDINGISTNVWYVNLCRSVRLVHKIMALIDFINLGLNP